MILAIYNILLITAGILLLPFFLLIILSRAKYRGRTLERSGLRIGKRQNSLFADTGNTAKKPVIWIHALSVGEVTSAVPLIHALQADMPEALIILTVGTFSGKQTAENLLAPFVQVILSGPFDLSFAIQRYIKAFQPDLFLLVETDFWPNWLALLHKQGIPAMLVNGRISEKSFLLYRRFAFLFRPMFRSFALLSMQTEADCRKMTLLGVPAEKMIALGNLKYDMLLSQETEKSRLLPELPGEEKFVWVCGSTHPGEEKYIFSAFAQVLAQQKGRKIEEQLILVLAPRDINRSRELVDLAGRFCLKAATRSSSEKKGRVLILDTLGELAFCYGQADLAFVGGSLVPQGGHNPVEPAIHGVPVLFGPSMEDFSEIAQELLACGGGKTVTEDILTETLLSLLADTKKRLRMGRAAQDMVERHRGGVRRHVQAVRDLLVRNDR